jgi:hypothetical protein
MIRIPSLAIAAIVFAATLAGCLRSSVTVIVKKDGSAIVRDSMLFSGFMGMMLLSDDDDDENPFMSDSSLNADAAAYGPDVRVLSKKRIAKGDAAGYTADFLGPDINKLTLFKTRASSKLSLDTTQSMAAPLDSSSRVTFAYRSGELTVYNHTAHRSTQEPVTSDTTQPPPSEEEMRAGLKMMRKMLDGMQMTYRIRVDGKIKKTTAKHVRRNDVTLLDVNVSKLFKAIEKDSKLFERASVYMGKQTPDEALLQLLPKGTATVEFQPIVTISF